MVVESDMGSVKMMDLNIPAFSIEEGITPFCLLGYDGDSLDFYTEGRFAQGKGDDQQIIFLYEFYKYSMKTHSITESKTL